MMKKSFISILLLAMVMILAISAVSAAEDIDSSDAVIGEVDEVPLEEVAIDDDALEASDDADVVAADGDGNFTSLQDLVNTKDEITLEKNYTRLVDEESVVINKTVTITGDNIQIDGKNLGTIFKVNDTGFLTLKGITLINGNAEKGGAIFNEGKLTVENCKFINNTAKYRGGAIYSEGIVNIDNTVFDTNDISYRAGKAKDNYGGATIFNLGGNLTVSNSKVLNSIKNYVYEKPNGKTGDQIGGAITSSGSTIILNSEFDKNSGRFGADICVLPINAGDVASLTIDNCNFTNARSYAGGVHIENAKADISNSKFENYVAGGAGSPGYSAAGGVICAMSETELSIENCTFNNNTAPKGGAILAQRVKKVSILNSNFTDNNATGTGKSLTKGYGGAVLIEKATDSSVVDGCTFINNTGVNGGAVAVDQNIVEIKNSNFDGNKATNGTAVYNNGTLTVSKNTFGENDTIESETIVAKDGSNVTISPIDNVTYGNPVVVYYTIENRSSNVTVSICYEDGDMQLPVENAVYTIDDDKVTITNLTADDYVIIIFNNEDDNVELSSDYAFFTVGKVNSSVAISPVANVTYGESVVVEYVIENRTNNVTVSICYNDGDMQPPVEGVNYTLENDKVVINDLAAGDYVIIIFNNEDDNVELSSDYAFFTVGKVNSSVAISPVANVTYGESVVVEYVIENRTNNVTVSICYNDGDMQPPVEGVNYTFSSDKVVINDLAAGDYVIFIYNGDDNVELSSDYAFFNVAKIDSELKANTTVNPDGEIVIDATINKNITGELTFIIRNETGAVVVNETELIYEGYSVLENIYLPKGYYTTEVIFAGDDYYEAAEYAIGEANITKEVSVIEIINRGVNEYGQIVINANITKGITGNVTFLFKNVDTSKNMTVSIEIGENGTIEYDENTPFEKGFYTIVISYAGDNNYYETHESTYVNVNKTVVTPSEATVVVKGGEVNVTFDLGVNATGNVHVVYPSGYEENITIENGTVKFYSEFQEQGNLTLVFDYDGDDNYYGFYEYYVDFFIKVDPELNANTTVSPEGQIIIDATVNSNVTGELTFIIKNETEDVVVNETVPIYMGFAILDNIYLPKGYYTTEVIFAGDDYYEAAEYAVGEANITKEVPVIEIINRGVNEYGQIVINANITKGITGNVTFLFKNVDTSKNMTVSIEIGENGTIEYDENTPFEKGFYTIGISYAGDNNYYEAYEGTYVNVNKTAVTPGEATVVVNGGTVNVTFDLGVNATGNVHVVYPSGYVDNITIENGTVKFYDVFQEQGNMTLVFDYDGDDNYYGFYEYYVDFFIKVDPELNVNTTVSSYGWIEIDAAVNVNVTGVLTFIIRNETGAVVDNRTKPIDGGFAMIVSDNLPKGYYTTEVIFAGDDYYEAAEYALGEANITKEVPVISYTVDVVANQAKITFKLPVDAEGNVTVLLMNYDSNVTLPISNGTVVLDEIFDNGNQTVILLYDGDDKYYAELEYVDFFVKASSFISAKDVSVVYQNNGKVTVTLTDNNDGKGNNPIANAEVVVTVNGKTYKGTTNAKGIATVTVPAKLVPKAYTAKVSYKGTATCYGDDATFKFTVKKATPKVTAKKKTFKKSKKVKKYTITLKDNKGKAIKKAKVTIKVGKKTFKAKTNAKGKAVFKLKKLTKKAKYKAKVTYKGNKYFKKVTKKVKITIK